MRIDISFKNLEYSRFSNNIVEKNLRKVERRIKIFRRNDPIHIFMKVEKNRHKQQYFCRIRVYLPGRFLNVTAKGVSFGLVVNKAFSAIFEQIERTKHKGEKQLRRKIKDRRR